MRKIAFLSMDSLDNYVCYDAMLERPLRDLGWLVRNLSWRDKNAAWDDFEAVVIRSTWDYQQDPEAFLQVLEQIDQSQARLENPLELVRWNLHKGYLRDLERQGIAIVPSLFRAAGEALMLDDAFERSGVDELIIKPSISANAEDTYRIRAGMDGLDKDRLEQIFSKKDALIQPFMPAVVKEGEFSLFYFGSEYSHGILKKPKTGDFRVQEEHGGQLTAIDPEPWLRQAADEAIAAIRPIPLYARVDFVRDTGLPGAGGDFYLMEMELIEPSLYFNMDPNSAARFAAVIHEWMG